MPLNKLWPIEVVVIHPMLSADTRLMGTGSSEVGMLGRSSMDQACPSVSCSICMVYTSCSFCSIFEAHWGGVFNLLFDLWLKVAPAWMPSFPTEHGTITRWAKLPTVPVRHFNLVAHLYFLMNTSGCVKALKSINSNCSCKNWIFPGFPHLWKLCYFNWYFVLPLACW